MMAYNNYYPATYQPNFLSPLYPQQQTGGIIWVQGEAGAKSYLVAPNSTVQLWDSERQSIYLKSADASGMPSIKTLDYTVRADKSASLAQTEEKVEYALKSDLEGFKEQIEALKAEIEEMKA